MSDSIDWVPVSCSLPTAAKPLRVAEFDDLFTSSVLAVDRIDAGTLSLMLTPTAEVAARAAALAVRETSCCSFFTFTLISSADTLTLRVSVPATHTDVVDGLQSLARPMANTSNTAISPTSAASPRSATTT